MEIRYPYEGKPSWAHTHVGVHLHPYAYHSWTLRPENRARHIPVLRRIRASHVLMMVTGDSGTERVDGKPAVCWYLDDGIAPIIRFSGVLNRPFPHLDAVKRLVAEYKPYGLRPAIQLWNELGDAREWQDGIVPTNWREIALGRIREAAPRVIEAGANYAFADPLSDWDWWFEGLANGDWPDWWREGVAIMAAHLYCKDRPFDYPEDDVSRYGTQLTEAEHRAGLDDFYHLWGNDPSLETINRQRLALADAKRTWRDDHTCFGAWRNIQAAAEGVLGGRVVMAMTEGGPTPDSRAGSGGQSTDNRYLRSTPKRVARQLVEMYRLADHGMYTLCPWLLWGGESAQFQSDFWLGSLYGGMIDQETGQPYGWEMPAIAALEAMHSAPAPEPELWQRVRRALGLVEEALAAIGGQV